MGFPIAELITGIFRPAAEMIDQVHTSDEERMDAKGRLLDKMITLITNALEYEARTLEARAKIVEAEAKSNNPLTAAWRPITMLTFLAIVVGSAFGWIDANNLKDVPEQMWTLLQIGIGGYIGGRSAEKVAGSIVGYLKEKKGADGVDGSAIKSG